MAKMMRSQEVAKMLDLPLARVRGLFRNGTLKGRKHGAAVLFDPASVRKYRLEMEQVRKKGDRIIKRFLAEEAKKTTRRVPASKKISSRSSGE